MQISIILLVLLVLYIIFTSENTLEAVKIIISAAAIAIFIRTFFIQPFTIPSGSMIPTLLVGDFIFVSQYKYGYSRYSLPLSLPLIKNRIFSKLPERGDVVVFKTPRDNKTDYVKTLIGLPGDKIKIKKGFLYINNQKIERESMDSTYHRYTASCFELGKLLTTCSTKFRDEIMKYTNEFDYVEILPNGKKHVIRETQGDDGPNDNTIEFKVPNNHFFMMGDNRDNSIDSRALSYVGFIPFNNLVGKAEIIFFSIDKNNYGLTKFWKWSIRFDRIGKILNKKINDLSWYETPVKAPVIETDKKNIEYEFVPGGGY